VVGTYGRGAWITDISPLGEINDSILGKSFHLFDILPKPQVNYSERAHWGNYRMMGDNHIRTPNEPNGLEVHYHIRQDLMDKGLIQLLDPAGKLISQTMADLRAGLHRTHIDTYRVKPGNYQVSLLIGRNRITKPAVVLPAPEWPIGHISEGNRR
jgi:hypothetical protein